MAIDVAQVSRVSSIDITLPKMGEVDIAIVPNIENMRVNDYALGSFTLAWTQYQVKNIINRPARVTVNMAITSITLQPWNYVVPFNLPSGPRFNDKKNSMWIVII